MGVCTPGQVPPPPTKSWTPISSTPLWPESGPGQKGCFCCGLSFLPFCLPKSSINQSSHPVYHPPPTPLGHNYPTQTRWVEGGASEWFRTSMGEQLSNSNLQSSLSPSYVPTALLHTTHPAHGKLGTHWRPQTQRPSSCTKAKGFFSLLG